MLRKGRWISASAMRVYLDQIGALHGAQQLPASTLRRMEVYVREVYALVPELQMGFLAGEEPPALGAAFCGLKEERAPTSRSFW